MSRVAIVYASRGGHTAVIARRIAETLRSDGHEPSLLADDDPSIAAVLREAEAVVIGAGIRYGSHGARIERLVRRHLATIAVRPNAFFSVSLSAGGPGANPVHAREYVERFVKRTGWQPQRVATIPGALTYTRYNPVLRLMMRLITRAAGGETDTTRDYEYTDWAAVARFAREILPAASRERAAA